MAKLRVHELAKELDVQAKDIIGYLTDKNVEVKSHMSTVEDDAVKMVRNKFDKKAAKPEAKQETAEADRPKKKSTISAVFNPQNSKNMGNRKGYHSQGGYSQDRNGRPVGTHPAKPQGDRPVRPQTEVKAAQPVEKPKMEVKEAPVEKPQVEVKTASVEMVQQTERPVAAASVENTATVNEHSRTVSNERPQGDKIGRAHV